MKKLLTTFFIILILVIFILFLLADQKAKCEPQESQEFKSFNCQIVDNLTKSG